MNRNSNYIINKIIDPAGRAKKAQVGVDLTVGKIEKVEGLAIFDENSKLLKDYVEYKEAPTYEEIIEQCPWASTGCKGRKPNIITSLELDPAVMEQRNLHLQAKYAEIEANETRYEEIDCEDAEYLIVAFGSCARIAQKSMEHAREEGIKVGLFRPITLWPFPSKALAEKAQHMKGILVVELNSGQMIEDVKLSVECRIPVEHFGRLGGIVPDPDEVIEALKERIINK